MFQIFIMHESFIRFTLNQKVLNVIDLFGDRCRKVLHTSDNGKNFKETFATQIFALSSDFNRKSKFIYNFTKNV